MSNFDEEFFKDLLREEREECLKGPGLDMELHEAFVGACAEFEEAREIRDEAHEEYENLRKAGDDKDAIKEAAGALKEAVATMSEVFDECVEAAKPLLETINLLDPEYDLEMSLLRTAVLTRATPKGLAKFAEESDLNGQIIETLLNNKKIMKEMLVGGGAKDGEFGNAMKQYTSIMANLKKDRFQKVNKKIAMAAALEFASKKTEFDSKKKISALKRFEHYEKAHRKGLLDPAFSHFSTWEYRLAINSDAPHDQLKWAREMLCNFSPHIATIYNQIWRYAYQIKTDVAIGAPKWTGNPRTYKMILDGGGREGPRSWYLRFICQAFGIPVWGFKEDKNYGTAKWTPQGWELLLSLNKDWNQVSWEGQPGPDFLNEAKARAAVTEAEFYEKVLLLECLSDACKEKAKTPEDAAFFSTERVWRSLAVAQRKIFADQATEESFQRTGPSIVVTKIEKYEQELSALKDPLPVMAGDDGVIIIPAASIKESNGDKFVKSMDSFGGGTQLVLVNGEAWATYEIPGDMVKEKGNFKLSCCVCTVHTVQKPLKISVDDGKPVKLEIPFTDGEWKDTTEVAIEIGPSSILKICRVKSNSCFGLAIKDFTLAPC